MLFFAENFQWETKGRRDFFQNGDMSINSLPFHKHNVWGKGHAIMASHHEAWVWRNWEEAGKGRARSWSNGSTNGATLIGEAFYCASWLGVVVVRWKFSKKSVVSKDHAFTFVVLYLSYSPHYSFLSLLIAFSSSLLFIFLFFVLS